MPAVDLERFYRVTPIWMQNALASLQGWRLLRQRHGPGYERIEREVESRLTLEGQALIDFQLGRLRAHLVSAAASPFWRERFADCGVRPGAKDAFSELARLPVLTKHEVQQDAARIANPRWPRSRLRSAHTSGTTGAGLVLYETRDAERERWATWWRYRRAFGIHPRMRSGHFGGRSVVPIEQQRPPFWRKNHFGRQLLLSAYHLGDETVESYWRALASWAPEWLHGYPSFIALFAELCEARGLPALPSVQRITVAAENLLDSQRRVIERVFAVPLHQHYGLAESVANVSERPDGSFRVDEDFAFVEFLPVSGDDGHRVVGTNWSNPAFPLLRYDTGDIAAIDTAEAARRGVWRDVRALDGRLEDYVILPSGARVGRLDHIFKDLVNVREAQIYQPSLDRVVFRIARGASYDDRRDEGRLLREVRTRLGDRITIDVEYVDRISRTSRGKLRFVISDLPRATLAGASPSIPR